MGDNRIGILVLAALVILAFAWLFAVEFASVAEKKGYPEKKYFWYCFFFLLIGCLLVIALPDRRTAPAAQADTDEIPEL